MVWASLTKDLGNAVAEILGRNISWTGKEGGPEKGKVCRN